jgi:hypothetical protein
MTDLNSDLAAARRSLQDLQRHVHALRGHLGDTLDVRRLAQDVQRLAESLAAVTEIAAAGAAPGPGAPSRLEVIPDEEYPRSFWEDAEDEGLGARDRHAP